MASGPAQCLSSSPITSEQSNGKHYLSWAASMEI